MTAACVFMELSVNKLSSIENILSDRRRFLVLRVCLFWLKCQQDFLFKRNKIVSFLCQITSAMSTATLLWNWRNTLEWKWSQKLSGFGSSWCSACCAFPRPSVRWRRRRRRRRPSTASGRKSSSQTRINSRVLELLFWWVNYLLGPISIYLIPDTLI